jgi:hypothetical protein
MSDVNVPKRVGTVLSDGINKYFLFFVHVFLWELNCHTLCMYTRLL